MKIRTGLALGVAAAVVLLATPLAARLFGALDRLPWETEREESAQPALLESLEDLSDFHAARGNYQVVVSIEESGFLPSAIVGEERTLMASGSVDASVDFSTLADGAIEVGPDDEVIVTLPAPQLEDAQVDPERSEVVEHDRGLFDRIAGAVTHSDIPESDLYALAGDELDDAATASDLLAQAEDNTTAMVEGMLAELGYDDVTVRFEQPEPSPT